MLDFFYKNVKSLHYLLMVDKMTPSVLWLSDTLPGDFLFLSYYPNFNVNDIHYLFQIEFGWILKREKNW